MDITGNDSVGGLAGSAQGIIEACAAAGAVGGNLNVGGLVGYSEGSVTDSSAAGTVSGFSYVGGLVGYLESTGTISGCAFTGTVSGVNAAAGGLVGENSGTIEDCTAAGTVRGASDVGGLAGFSAGSIDVCTADSQVWGIDQVGGLVGSNYGPITDGHSMGAVSGESLVGGLAGLSCGSIDISHSLASVSGGDYVGGLAGRSQGDIFRSWANGSVTGSGDCTGGLVGQSDSSITDSFSRGTVNGDGSVGGLVGENSGHITRTWAAGPVSGNTGLGGLVGQNTGDAPIASYYDRDTTGRADTGKGVPTDTAAMRLQTTYAGWDFTATWGIDPLLSGGYPYLQWQDFTLTGSGTAAAPYLISLPEHLDLVRNNLAAHYRLAADLDLTAFIAAHYPAGGWLPIGAELDAFTGTFNGGGHTIRGLVIDRPEEEYVGLFGCAGADSVLADIHLCDADVKGGSNVGALVGYTDGTITGCSAAGTVSGADGIGGLAGGAGAFTADSSFTGAVSGNNWVGGLAGWSVGSIADCSAAGTVGGQAFVGGLVGENEASIARSQADSAVTGSSDYIGGLTGQASDGISDSFALGTVQGSEYVGGLAGVAVLDIGITRSWSGAAVTGTGGYIGGLVGSSGAAIADCYATGPVVGTDEHLGGLVGENGGPITRSWAGGPVSGTETNIGGLAGSYEAGSITASCYDLNTTGQTDASGQGLTTAAMQDQSSYAAWDFTATWSINPDQNGGYPTLLWQEWPMDGSGTDSDPYLIETPAQLDRVREDPDACYQLTADLDLTVYITVHYPGDGWMPIGTPTAPFTGSFDGNAHTISSLVINRPAEDYIGLFGCTAHAAVLTDIRLTDADITGDDFAGILVGHSAGTIDSCYTVGSVSGDTRLGGLTGHSAGAIDRCSANGTVDGTSTVGGLVGFGDNSTDITASWSGAAVNAEGSCAGGLTGHTRGPITDAYAAGPVSGTDYVGGLTGLSEYSVITRTWASGAVTGDGPSQGGLVGATNFTSVETSYYDTETTGQADTGKGIPTATASMRLQATFSGWDFAATWVISPVYNEGYPFLRWGRYFIAATAENGTVTGAGTFNAGESVTLSADPDDGYTFDGWYAGVVLRTPQPVYRFAASSDLLLEARFTAMPTSQLIVTTLDGGTVRLGTEAIGNEYTDSHPQDAAITLTALPNEGYTFAWWTDEDTHSIISTEAVYESFIGRGLNLEAVFSKTPTPEDTAFNVFFRDRSGRILQSDLVSKGEAAVAPAAPSLVGYNFAGWNQALGNVQADRLLTARYTRLPNTWVVIVQDGTIQGGGTTGAYLFDKPVTVVADTAPAGQQFSHWERDGMNVSYNSTYAFHTLWADTTLTAHFVDTEAAEAPEPCIAIYQSVLADTADHSLQFTASRAVPAGYTFVESGIILLQTEVDPGAITLTTPGIRRGKVGLGSTDQFSVRIVNATPGATWYARAYLICRDDAGNLFTVYSEDTAHAAVGGA